jgi:hypothetical protein
MIAPAGGRLPRAPSPKRISPDSRLSVKTSVSGFVTADVPGGRRGSSPGTSGPALNRSSISPHTSQRPLRSVTVRRTEPAMTGVCERNAT